MPKPTDTQILEERRQLRRLQLLMALTAESIRQDPAMTFEEASRLVGAARHAALEMFPGKELAFDILYRPRFQRLLLEKYRLH